MNVYDCICAPLTALIVKKNMFNQAESDILYSMRSTDWKNSTTRDGLRHFIKINDLPHCRDDGTWLSVYVMKECMMF